MDVKDLRNKTALERRNLAEELRRKVRDLRFSIITRQQAKVRTMRRAKKDLAQVLTVMREQHE